MTKESVNGQRTSTLYIYVNYVYIHCFKVTGIRPMAPMLNRGPLEGI